MRVFLLLLNMMKRLLFISLLIITVLFACRKFRIDRINCETDEECETMLIGTWEPKGWSDGVKTARIFGPDSSFSLGFWNSSTEMYENTSDSSYFEYFEVINSEVHTYYFVNGSQTRNFKILHLTDKKARFSDREVTFRRIN